MLKLKNFRKIMSVIMVSVLIFGYSIPANAYAGCAYSYGGSFNSGLDVTTSCNYWAMCGYSSYYTTNPTYSYVSLAARLNSDLLFFSGYGNQTSVMLKNNIYVTDGYSNGVDIVGVQTYVLNNTRLVYYSASSTAAGSSNLCNTTLSRGVGAVLGWADSIGIDDSFKWQKRFQNHCALGYRLYEAVNYANSFSDYDSNLNIKYQFLYGDYMQIIKVNKSAQTALSSEEDLDYLRINEIDTITSDFESINYIAIESAISSKKSDFNASDYEITKTSNSLDDTAFIVDYTLKVNGFSTNSGYTIIFRDNEASVFYDNTINSTSSIDSELSTQALSETTDQENLENALKEAAAKVEEIGKGSVILSQKATKFLDINTNEYYYKVYTEYDYMNTGGIGAISTLYSLM